MNNRVLVIVVTFNSQRTINQCLRSLGQSKQNYPLDCLVVDNASTDETLFTVRKHPWVLTHFNKENLGFAQANNWAIKWGLDKNYHFFALVNPDTFVTQNWLREIIPLFDQSPSAGIIQPMILLNKQPNLINSSGNSLHFLGFSTCHNSYQEYQAQNWKVLKISAASGACMVIKDEVFKRAGFLDENFFLYYEDSEFSWRAQLFGFQILLAPKAMVYHDYLFKKNTPHFRDLERNRLIAWCILWSPKTKRLLLSALIGVEFILLFYSLLNGQVKQKWLSWIDFIKELPNLKKKALAIQSQRKLSDKQLLPIFSARIFFPQKKQPRTLAILNFLLEKYWNLVKPFI